MSKLHYPFMYPSTFPSMHHSMEKDATSCKQSGSFPFCRGQATIFIILAIFILITFLGLVMLSVNQQPAKTATLRNAPFETIVHDAQEYIQSCIAMKSTEPINQLALHGGRFTPNSGIFYEGAELHPFCTYATGKGCVNSVTTQSSLEQELKQEISEEITPCLDLSSVLGATKTTFSTGTANLNVSISPDAVSFDLTYPIRIRLGTNQRELTHFSTAVEAPLGRLFRTALDIANSQASTGFFDKDLYMAYHDSSITIQARRPYPNIVYQLRRKDPKTSLDFLFQVAIAGKETAGTEALTWEPSFGCCLSPDNTCHTNVPSGICNGKSEAKGCHCPSNAVPEVEGCCVHGDRSCGITPSGLCTSPGDTYFEDDLLCSKAPGCTSLDCQHTYNMPSRSLSGPARKNGESWCVYDGPVGNGNDLVGSRHYVHSCIRGQELVEPCRDYREELCAESRASTMGGGNMAHAACRINRFADCTSQGDPGNCEDSSVRDCEWLPSVYSRSGAPTYNRIKCIPKVAPGLKFWSSTGLGVCQHSSDDNPPRKRKRTFAYQVQHACSKSGDCGAKRNILDMLTKGGYFNPDGDLEDGKLVPGPGENKIIYPGLPLSIDDRRLPSLPNLLTPASGGGYAICSLWHAPASGDCSICMSNPLHPCTEYQCNSIGKNCKFSQHGLGIPTCSAAGSLTPGLNAPVITKLESSPSRLQRMGGTEKIDEYNVVPALRASQPWNVYLETDQPTRCHLSILSKDLVRNAANTWLLCPLPAMPDLCITIPTVYLSRARLSTNHTIAIRIPYKERLIGELPESIKSTLADFIERPTPLYLRCKNGNDTETKEVEFKIHATGNSEDERPSIIEVHPSPEAVHPGQTTPIDLFADRPFTECNVATPGGATIRLCGGIKPWQITYNRIDAPPGSYECAGSSLSIESGSYTFFCSDEHGRGPNFLYQPGTAGVH